MMEDLLKRVRACTICKEYLPLGPKPVLRASPNSKIAVIGQAPGTKVHASGIPWDDASGKRLRQWLNVTNEQFYDEEIFAIVPMGFCYPGKGKTGDLPPRKECAQEWHTALFEAMPNIELFLLIGQYAQKHYLNEQMKKNLTETVKSYHDYHPKFIPLPHPSPRNIFWFKRNQWFELDLVPYLESRVKEILDR